MELSSISLTHKSQKGDDCFGRIRPNGPPNVFIGGRHSPFEGNLRAIGQSKIEITLQVPKVQEFVTRQDVLRVKYNGEGGPDYAVASSGKILLLSVAFLDDVFKYFSRRRDVPSDLTAM